MAGVKSEIPDLQASPQDPGERQQIPAAGPAGAGENSSPTSLALFASFLEQALRADYGVHEPAVEVGRNDNGLLVFLLGYDPGTDAPGVDAFLDHMAAGMVRLAEEIDMARSDIPEMDIDIDRRHSAIVTGSLESLVRVLQLVSAEEHHFWDKPLTEFFKGEYVPCLDDDFRAAATKIACEDPDILASLNSEPGYAGIDGLSEAVSKSIVIENFGNAPRPGITLGDLERAAVAYNAATQKPARPAGPGLWLH